MDSWGSQDILAGFEPADPRSNRGESVILKLAKHLHTDDFFLHPKLKDTLLLSSGKNH